MSQMRFALALQLACATCAIGCSSGDSTGASTVTTLSPKATVIDSATLVLQSSAAELSAGTYRFAAIGTVPSFPPETVIVGAAQGGYLRVVRTTSASGGLVT